MNRLDTNLQGQPFAIATASPVVTVPSHRFVVLIPADADYSDVAHRIWELAHDARASVQFLGLCRDAAQEPSLRRELVTLAALVYDGHIATEIKIETGMNWLSAVRSNYQPGDVIVCFAEQRAGILHKPLSQILQAKLNATVYVLSGPETPVHRKAEWRSTLTLWGGFIITAIGFFILQVNIDKAVKGGIQMVMLVLTVLVEFWLIWAWNNLFS